MVNTIQYKSWKSFVHDYKNDLFRSDVFLKGKMLFRGQADSSWRLTSSFDRRYGSCSWTLRQQIESDLLINFRDNCIRHLGDSFVDNLGDIQLKNLAQHYGIPTRLLDWTDSPFIAAYFAFSGVSNRTGSVAIWALSTEHEIWQSNIGVKIHKEVLANNERQKHQLGCFTELNAPQSSVDEFVDVASEGRSGDALIRMIIPAGEYKQAMSELDAMNINASTIFGGLEGCALSALSETELKYLDRDIHR